MILSHSHKFIVFKTRKTGGTSLEIALSKYVSAQDVVTPIAASDEEIRASLGLPGPQNHVLLRREAIAGRKFYNHIGAEEVRSMIPADVFSGYVKAAIVRNPFDYVVSWYYWERDKRPETSHMDFRQWLMFQFQHRSDMEAQYQRKLRNNPGVFASNRLITHVGGSCAMDFMLRQEFLKDDVARFAQATGLPPSLADEVGEIRAKGGYRPRSATAVAMFEGFPAGEELIRSAFAEEIETYGYALT
jgi:hypothetical protein